MQKNLLSSFRPPMFDALRRRAGVLYQRFNICHKRDQTIIDLVIPNLETGPWIAGGSVLCWLKQEPVREHDIDVFVRDAAQFQQVTSRLRHGGFQLHHESANAITFKTSSAAAHTVQVVKFFFNSVDDLLTRFDFTVCAVATDGDKIHAVPQFQEDFENKVLRLQGKLKEDALKRIVKYSVYGYMPTNKLLDAVYAKKDLINTFDQDQYNFEI